MRVRCVLFTQINDSDYPMYWRAYTALNAIRWRLLIDDQQADNTYVDEYYLSFYHLIII